jgi:pimeloyl-ACP methyl ester carboxylesterase
MQANVAALRVVAGDPYMHDPGLRERLGEASIPVLVLWGDSDGIASPNYGRAYAESFSNARFELVADAGHLPQIEQPAATFALIDAFVNGRDRS